MITCAFQYRCIMSRDCLTRKRRKSSVFQKARCAFMPGAAFSDCAMSWHAPASAPTDPASFSNMGSTGSRSVQRKNNFHCHARVHGAACSPEGSDDSEHG